MELVHKSDGGSPVVLFATPAFDKSVSVDFHTSMMRTYLRLWQAGIWCDTHIVAGMQWTDIARNELVHRFLTDRAAFTDLLFIDSDQGWDGDAILRIIQSDKAVVCALPPKKSETPSFHSDGLTGLIDGHLFQAIAAGTGLMRIKREVFARLDAAHPDLKELTSQKNPWPHTPYFQDGNTKYGRLGEDIFFCHLLRDLGEYIWIDADVDFSHHGQKRWTGNLFDHLVSTGVLKTA